MRAGFVVRRASVRCCSVRRSWGFLQAASNTQPCRRTRQHRAEDSMRILNVCLASPGRLSCSALARVQLLQHWTLSRGALHACRAAHQADRHCLCMEARSSWASGAPGSPTAASHSASSLLMPAAGHQLGFAAPQQPAWPAAALRGGVRGLRLLRGAFAHVRPALRLLFARPTCRRTCTITHCRLDRAGKTSRF